MTAARLRRLVGFAILCETLAEAAARGLLPYFFIKGGVAIELRLGLSARTTKDIDGGLCAAPQDLLPLFDRALSVGFGDFVLRRKGENRLLGNGVCSLKVSVIYMTRDWATVDVDLAPAEPDIAIEEVEPVALSDFGLAAARRVPCLAIVEQVAQKIHALTEPNPRGKPNPRARDVIDVLALDARIALDGPAVANSCARLLKKRGVHDWPISTYAFPSEWATTLPTIARDARYDTIDVATIQERFNSFLARLHGSTAGYERPT